MLEMNSTADKLSIDLRNVSVLRGERWILDKISWQVPAGSYAAILGPNGSGKSTLTRVITGYMWPTRGEATINGKTFGQTDINALRQSIRLVQPAGPFDADPDLTTRQVVLTGLYGTIGLFQEPPAAAIERADELLRRVGLSRLADAKYETLSTGERMRSLIARALIESPALLLLDEPSNGLDLRSREQVLAALDALSDFSANTTLVMITHHVEELSPKTSHILLLDDGKVAAAGSPSEVLRADLLSRVYRCPLNVQTTAGRWYIHVDPSARLNLLGEEG